MALKKYMQRLDIHMSTTRRAKATQFYLHCYHF